MTFTCEIVKIVISLFLKSLMLIDNTINNNLDVIALWLDADPLLPVLLVEPLLATPAPHTLPSPHLPPRSTEAEQGLNCDHGPQPISCCLGPPLPDGLSQQ